MRERDWTSNKRYLTGESPEELTDPSPGEGSGDLKTNDREDQRVMGRVGLLGTGQVGIMGLRYTAC